MQNHFWKTFSLVITAALFTFQFSSTVYAEDNYRSKFINQTNQGQVKYTLDKTRVWPETGCLVDAGKSVLLPGDETELVISKKAGCEQAGIGYSFYKTEDTKREHLLGYVSHRFMNGQFSLQVSMFCEGHQCVFRDLNPDQTHQ